MARVLWLSRHDPLPRQIDALRRLYGDDVEVVQDVSPFRGADDIVERIRRGGYDDVLVVAPLSVIHQLTQRGIYPLWAEMERVDDPRLAEVVEGERMYRFVALRRIRELRLIFEEAQPYRMRHASEKELSR